MSCFYPADILLPKKNSKEDYEKWAVIACDQHTSNQQYWDDVEKIVGDAPSSLRIMLPEIYLGKDNSAAIQKVNATMDQYMKDDVLEVHPNSMIYVERQVGDKIRRGLVGMVDLEEYDFNPGSDALIRATEATIIDRLPPRIQIRQNAPLEMPHVLMLFDDATKSVVAPLEANKDELEVAYDFDLMKNGGHIKAWFLTEELMQSVENALDKLTEEKNGLLFVVGDGNHSLAAAKEYYKKSGNPLARYALVEIENVHDESLEFESIYRVLFNVDREDFIAKFKNYTDKYGTRNLQTFRLFSKGGSRLMNFKATAELPVGTLQSFIDRYVEIHSEVTVDYIHGEKEVERLCDREDTLGFVYAGLRKDELFTAVDKDGALPRKTFSMGHADDKRFYIECRKIK